VSEKPGLDSHRDGDSMRHAGSAVLQHTCSVALAKALPSATDSSSYLTSRNLSCVGHHSAARGARALMAALGLRRSAGSQREHTCTQQSGDKIRMRSVHSTHMAQLQRAHESTSHQSLPVVSMPFTIPSAPPTALHAKVTGMLTIPRLVAVRGIQGQSTDAEDSRFSCSRLIVNKLQNGLAKRLKPQSSCRNPKSGT